MPYIKTDVKDVYGKMMNVICPKCQKIHKMRMLWIGQGTPRKFCQACLHSLGNAIAGSIDDSQYHKYAATSHAQGRS